MPRKKVSEMTPGELKAYREYMRKAKRKSRAGQPPEKDSRTYSDRAEYKREYMRDYRKKTKKKP